VRLSAPDPKLTWPIPHDQRELPTLRRQALADEDQRHDYQQNATNGKAIRSRETRTLINSQLQNAIFCHT